MRPRLFSRSMRPRALSRGVGSPGKEESAVVVSFSAIRRALYSGYAKRVNSRIKRHVNRSPYTTTTRPPLRGLPCVCSGSLFLVRAVYRDESGSPWQDPKAFRSLARLRFSFLLSRLRLMCNVCAEPSRTFRVRSLAAFGRILG